MALFDDLDLKEANELFVEVETLANIGTYIFYPYENKVYWSRGLYNILGYQPGEVKPTVENYYARVHPDDLEVHFKQYTDLIENNEPTTLHQMRLLLPGGHVRYVRLRSIERRNKKGEVTKMIGTFLDITNEITFQDEKLQREKLESLHILTHGVAHDFNNFLQTITTSLDTIKNKMNQDQTSRDFLEQLRVIERASLYSASLVDKMLSLAQKKEGDSQSIDLGKTLLELKPLIQSVLGDSVQLSLEYTASNYVLLNKVDLAQILINLAKNAQEAMPAGGQLSVRAFEKSEHHMNPDDENHTYTCIQISDNGIGIDPDKIKNIFDPFYTTKREEKSKGLGLSSVYSLVTQHGAKIFVQSEPKKGTTFFLYVREAKSEPKSEESLITSTAQQELKILYVEDNIDLREVMHELLSEEFDVEACTNGVEAAEKYNSSYDVVITDVSMPKMNGEDLATEIWQRNPLQKIIFLTGFNKANEYESVIRNKPALVLRKPINLSQLREAIESLMSEEGSSISKVK